MWGRRYRAEAYRLAWMTMLAGLVFFVRSAQAFAKVPGICEPACTAGERFLSVEGNVEGCDEWGIPPTAIVL